jgi:hypothetical protein
MSYPTLSKDDEQCDLKSESRHGKWWNWDSRQDLQILVLLSAALVSKPPQIRGQSPFGVAILLGASPTYLCSHGMLLSKLPQLVLSE